MQFLGLPILPPFVLFPYLLQILKNFRWLSGVPLCVLPPPSLLRGSSWLLKLTSLTAFVSSIYDHSGGLKQVLLLSIKMSRSWETWVLSDNKIEEEEFWVRWTCCILVAFKPVGAGEHEYLRVSSVDPVLMQVTMIWTSGQLFSRAVLLWLLFLMEVLQVKTGHIYDTDNVCFSFFKLLFIM